MRGAWRDAEFFRNHPGRDDRASHDIVDEGGQPGGGAAASELAHQQGAGGGPTLVLLDAGLGGRRERVGEGDEARGLVTRPAPVPRHGAQPDGEAGKMGFGLAARAEQRRDQQTPEPGAVLQRRDLLPGVEREGGGDNGRQGRGFRDDGVPVGQTFILVPVEIVDQRMAGFLGSRHESVHFVRDRLTY